MAAKAPAPNDVRCPQKSRQPQAGKGHCAVRNQPPMFERMWGRSEVCLANEKIMEKEPESSAQPNTGRCGIHGPIARLRGRKANLTASFSHATSSQPVGCSLSRARAA